MGDFHKKLQICGILAAVAGMSLWGCGTSEEAADASTQEAAGEQSTETAADETEALTIPEAEDTAAEGTTDETAAGSSAGTADGSTDGTADGSTDGTAAGSAGQQDPAAAGTGTEDPAQAGAGSMLSFDNCVICQFPELPTGCEITSLAMLLNYHGIAADKCDLSDNYLDKGEVGTVNFREAFEGDPREEASFGCYAPVIVNTANRYLAAAGSELQANDISGQELESLFPYIDAGVPVMVWGTLDCQEGHYSVTWNVNGEDLTWFTPEHCRVLIGYDSSQVWTADPYYGDIRYYPIEQFKASYDSLYKQAVVIQ